MKAEMSQPQGRRKHIPQRTCVVCRQTAAKRSLVRIVRTADEGIQVDTTGKRNGRGAYLCDQAACWLRAVESDVLEKALRTTFTEEDRQRLREVLTHKSGPEPS
jgi:predicted RNA-binding protein YlxR (DUF448 family)